MLTCIKEGAPNIYLYNDKMPLNAYLYTLQWRHNGRDGVSNHPPHDCLLNRLFRCRSKRTSKPHVTGLCAGNSPVTDEFPAQMASNAENTPIWWRHHEWQDVPVLSCILNWMASLSQSAVTTSLTIIPWPWVHRNLKRFDSINDLFKPKHAEITL